VTSDIRIDPEEFDAPWLTGALEDAGVANGATITELEFTGYVGTGQMSRNGRFRLSWSDPDGRPPTVVAKFPSADVPTRSWAFETGTYGSEYTFYTAIAPTVRVRTPECWVARYDEAGQRCVLVMEDLAQSAQGDQFDGCSPDQVPLVLEQAVAFHAPRWGDPTLAPLLVRHDSAERAERIVGLYAAAVEVCLDRLGDRFSDDVVKLVEGFGGVIRRWSAGTDTPRTVVHGDFRPDNFLFAIAAGAPPLAVVDWQTMAHGCGPTDIAYFLGGAFPEDQRRQMERDLVEDYRRQLNAAGVVYSEQDCWRDYRWGTLHGMVIGVLATMMAAQTERGDRLFTLMVSRHARHALDLDVLGLIDQAAGA
jgi:hypothetical protein